MLGRFELKLNTWTFIEYINGTGRTLFPWLMISLRTPTITLPFYKLNELGEWERIFCVSAPTLIQLSDCSDISWEGHLMVLGFGVSFIYQYGF
jgi:hypothetical protein